MVICEVCEGGDGVAFAFMAFAFMLFIRVTTSEADFFSEGVELTEPSTTQNQHDQLPVGMLWRGKPQILGWKTSVQVLQHTRRPPLPQASHWLLCEGGGRRGRIGRELSGTLSQGGEDGGLGGGLGGGQDGGLGGEQDGGLSCNLGGAQGGGLRGGLDGGLGSWIQKLTYSPAPRSVMKRSPPSEPPNLGGKGSVPEKD